LLETPAERWQVGLSVLVAGLTIAAVGAVAPFRDLPLGRIHGFVPAADLVQLVAEAIICALLYAEGAATRSRALCALASGYLFMAVLVVPHMLTFPGAFAPEGLLGAGVNTTVWLSSLRRVAFPTAAILYLLLKKADEEAGGEEAGGGAPRPAAWAAGALALAAAATAWTTLGHAMLPPLFVDSSRAIVRNMTLLSSVTGLLILAAIIMLLMRKKTVLELWLLVALWVWFCQFLPLQGRFTVGWYYLFGTLTVANLVVIVALIGETARQRRRG
jgi:hypothetical protein